MNTQKIIPSLSIIGSTDKVDFPDFSLLDVPCKIDTGREKSALRCQKIECKVENNSKVIYFSLSAAATPLRLKANTFKKEPIEFAAENTGFRYCLTTEIVLCGQIFTTDFILLSADDPAFWGEESEKYPVLLGKNVLKKRFLIDVTQNDRSYTQKTESFTH